MTITIRPAWFVLGVAVLGVLVGMAISQVTGAGATANPAATASASDAQVVRKLGEINATLGSASGGSIAPVLRKIETYTYNACRAIEDHPYGHCQ